MGGDVKSIKLALLLVLVVALAALALQNQAPWRVRFFWLTGEVPGSILLFLTAATGLIVGITVALLVKQGARKRRQK